MNRLKPLLTCGLSDGFALKQDYHSFYPEVIVFNLCVTTKRKTSLVKPKGKARHGPVKYKKE